MKARSARLASASPNWRYLHGLDTQCWQRIPAFNYGVVTMDTTYSTPISITPHMVLCEGHTNLRNPTQSFRNESVGSLCLVNYRRMEVTIKLTVINIMYEPRAWHSARWKIEGVSGWRGIWMQAEQTESVCYYNPVYVHSFMRPLCINTILCIH